jgi:hypothetical protein
MCNHTPRSVDTTLCQHANTSAHMLQKLVLPLYQARSIVTRRD